MSERAAEGMPRRHRLTAREYRRMGETGVLPPDERVELIEGQIIDMPPIGSPHAGTVNQLARLLQRAIGDRAILQIQNPVSLDQYSEPEPDLAITRPWEPREGVYSLADEPDLRGPIELASVGGLRLNLGDLFSA